MQTNTLRFSAIRTCEECSGEIIRAAPHLDLDGYSVGSEDAHFVCRRCGLIVEQWWDLGIATSRLDKVERDYYAKFSHMWESRYNGNLGTVITPREFKRILKHTPRFKWQGMIELLGHSRVGDAISFLRNLTLEEEAGLAHEQS